MLDYLPFAGLALLLGFKHSYDADHIIAVANFLRKAQTFKSAVKVSVSWALGHMITAAIVTTILYVFRESLLTAFLASFEKIVGVMLILLGLFSLKDLFKPHSVHSHLHEHNSKQHVHAHSHDQPGHLGHIHKDMFGIGIIHGLASNDELLILLTASLGMATLPGILFGVAVFSLGVVLGMVAFALIFSYPLLKARSDAIYKAITVLTGVVSVMYGTAMLAAVV